MSIYEQLDKLSEEIAKKHYEYWAKKIDDACFEEWTNTKL